jgi:pimeloyl-ACP methyl ester carboxylesterase
VSTFVLVPGAGGSGWELSVLAARLVERGHRAVPVDLPAADESAGLHEYADAIVAAVPRVPSGDPVVLVAQSFGGFSAPLAAARLPVAELVLLNAMVPRPGETFSAWWSATGQGEAAAAAARRDGRPETFDMVEDFFHDVPADLRAEAFARGEPTQAERPLTEPWPLDAWPAVPTRVLAGADDRMFPPDFQARVACERLGLPTTVVPGGHLAPLSFPDELANALLVQPADGPVPANRVHDRGR